MRISYISVFLTVLPTEMQHKDLGLWENCDVLFPTIFDTMYSNCGKHWHVFLCYCYVILWWWISPLSLVLFLFRFNVWMCHIWLLAAKGEKHARGTGQRHKLVMLSSLLASFTFKLPLPRALWEKITLHNQNTKRNIVQPLIPRLQLQSCEYISK